MEHVGTKYAFTAETAAALCHKPHACRKNRLWCRSFRGDYTSETEAAVRRIKKGNSTFWDRMHVRLFGERLYKIAGPPLLYHGQPESDIIEGYDEECAIRCLVAIDVEGLALNHLSEYGRHDYKSDCPGCVAMWSKVANWLNQCSIERVF